MIRSERILTDPLSILQVTDLLRFFLLVLLLNSQIISAKNLLRYLHFPGK